VGDDVGDAVGVFVIGVLFVDVNRCIFGGDNVGVFVIGVLFMDVNRCIGAHVGCDICVRLGV
jgi:hypothetical protein